ncbi:hypothetical protein DM860_017668 [Cuscuta australis]|uniref:FYVE-type domain-containing protein n=1 Tax=Cuscuta australis TaxID=267555 RepID=A0A328D9Y4_9ASTE|nr:hypothetical protein DM860_017668 [Cuscuta australis]
MSYSPKMQVKASNSDVLRVSVSSAPSTSSHGSAPDDYYDALSDVYIWGEVICDNTVKVGPEKNSTTLNTRTDVLLPRPLESHVVLDVSHIACGVRHAALVTRHGEVFTWGEESGGRLGHGVGKDAIRPHLVESLSFQGIELVACGEFHTCAVTADGELYTWGDGTHNAGLLGHGSDVSHWIPKRILGPLEGVKVSMVACGPWHSALITSTGRLFTFGDGTFGVLGHGDRESVLFPREVSSLSGLRTISVACGVWHTAAVVEVIVSTQPSASFSSGKLFTWGDGDKHRLGHGDKDPRLEPTCVPALIDHNFHKIACGHCLTVGLTTSGRVFTMGSTVYGQLGNPKSDGKLPCLVEDKLGDEECIVDDIACGSYHVAVLTSRSEVFTWGKGANGRLGHGDIEDRKTPTLVEVLKDRVVKYVACGSSYTAVICLHKWISVAEQSQCSSCRQAFGFTRKRHNCYNCGLLFCHACSSRKALRAGLAPNPKKPYRVCDSCYTKLSMVVSMRRSVGPRLSGGENKDKLDKDELRLAKSGMPSNLELIKQLDYKAAKQGKKTDMFSLGPTFPKPALTTLTGGSRSVSPFSRRSSPPRSATPLPTVSGLSFSKNIVDSLKRNNEVLNQEIHKLRAQVENLRHRCEVQEIDLQKSAKKAQEALFLAAEESAKCKAAKEVIMSLTAQLKDMAERMPPGTYDAETFKLAYPPNGLEPNGLHHSGDTNVDPSGVVTSNKSEDRSSPRFLKGSGAPTFREHEPLTGNREPVPSQENTAGSKSRVGSIPLGNDSQIEAEWIEQYEPGVYITLVALRDGTRDLKRVRFSRRRFGEQQAESWWSENRDNVYERYNIRGSSSAAMSDKASCRSEGPLSPSSQR